MRWLKWGYDPARGALDKRVVLVNDESGVDVSSRGGFTACGYTEDQFLMWWNKRRELYEAFPQQYVFNLFQGDPENARWAGYRVNGYLGVLRRIWGGQAPRQAGHVRLGLLAKAEGDSPLPASWNPERKEH